MSEKKFPWGCVLGGCATVVVLVIVVIGGLSYFGVKKAKEFAEEMKNPEARSDKVCKILGAEALPEGYYPVVGLSVPFVVDFAMLGDHPMTADEHEGPRERGFLYFSVLSTEDQRLEVEDFFEGRRKDTSFLNQQNIDLDLRDEIGRGGFEQEAQDVSWIAYRGEIEISDTKSDGITSVMMVRCGGDSKRIRMGILFGPDPNPKLEVGEFDPSGTPADQGVLENFMAQLRLCR